MNALCNFLDSNSQFAILESEADESESDGESTNTKLAAVEDYFLQNTSLDIRLGP